MTNYHFATTILLVLLASTSNSSAFQTSVKTPLSFASLSTLQQKEQQPRIKALYSSAPDSTTADNTATTTQSTTPIIITTEETKALFYTLADSLLKIDPSNGSCCRSGCSGCSYLDEKSGDFLYEEYTSPVVSEGEESTGVAPAWIAAYDHSDIGRSMSKEALRSKWSTLLFSVDGEDENAMEVTKEKFEEVITNACASSYGAKIVSLATQEDDDDEGDYTTEMYEISSSPPSLSTEAIEALWGMLSPTPGLPMLTKSDIVTSLKDIQQSSKKWGGAITFSTFSTALQSKAAAIANGEWDGTNFIDYESMEVEALQELVEERDLRRVPKIKKFMIEELRFFDEHGRQGKRHPVKRTLS